MRSSMVKINVTVSVPAGEFCFNFIKGDQCSYLDGTYPKICLLFNEALSSQDGKVSKCAECKISSEEMS